MTTTSDESPTSTATVATNFIFTAEERERMNTALEMVEDALDVEHWRKEGSDSDSDSDSACDGDETQHHNDHHHHHHHHDHRQELEASFHREQEEKRHSLFRSAIAIQESVAGFYHPDVANTYHFYGWFLYERSRHAHALVCFLQALKICYRLLGSEHTSTRVVLDDLRFVAAEHERDLREERERRKRERRNLLLGSSLPAAATAQSPTRKRTLAESFDDEPVRLEEDCSSVFDSWECQYYAEDALLALKNPSTALEWYREALKVLPTRTIPTCTAEYDDNSDYDDDINNDENDHNSETEDETTITSSCHEHEHEHKHEHENLQENPKEDDADTDADADANSDHVHPSGGSIGRPQSPYHHPSEDFAPVCLGELERATVQMHIGDVLHFSMDHAAPRDPRHRERNTERCLRDAAGWYRCALEVLPRWLAPDHPTLERLEGDASSARADAARMRRERLSGTEQSTTTNSNINSKSKSSSNSNSEG